MSLLEAERKREAMQSLLGELCLSREEEVPSMVRTALERGWAEEFGRPLRAQRERKAQEINKICMRYHGEFLGSVQGLLDMRASAASLGQHVRELNTDLDTTAQDVLRMVDELTDWQVRKRTIQGSAQVLRRAKALTNDVIAALEEVQRGDHYAALESMERIRRERHSPAARALAGFLDDYLPQINTALTEAAQDDLAQWLEDAKDIHLLMGKSVIYRFAKVKCEAGVRRLRWTLENDAAAGGGGGGGGGGRGGESRFTLSVQEQEQILRPGTGSLSVSFVRQWLSNTILLDDWISPHELDACVPEPYLVRQAVDEDLLESVPRTFAPLHKSLHVFAKLGALDQFQHLYFDGRSQQMTVQAILVASALRTGQPLQQPQQHHSPAGPAGGTDQQEVHAGIHGGDRDGDGDCTRAAARPSIHLLRSLMQQDSGSSRVSRSVVDRAGEKLHAIAVVVANICGFFVHEALVRQSVDYPHGLPHGHDLTELWSRTCRELLDFVRRELTLKPLGAPPIVALSPRASITSPYAAASPPMPRNNKDAGGTDLIAEAAAAAVAAAASASTSAAAAMASPMPGELGGPTGITRATLPPWAIVQAKELILFAAYTLMDDAFVGAANYTIHAEHVQRQKETQTAHLQAMLNEQDAHFGVGHFSGGAGMLGTTMAGAGLTDFFAATAAAASGEADPVAAAAAAATAAAEAASHHYPFGAFGVGGGGFDMSAAAGGGMGGSGGGASIVSGADTSAAAGGGGAHGSAGIAGLMGAMEEPIAPAEAPEADHFGGAVPFSSLSLLEDTRNALLHMMTDACLAELHDSAREALTTCEYQPMTVESAAELHQQVTAFSLDRIRIQDENTDSTTGRVATNVADLVDAMVDDLPGAAGGPSLATMPPDAAAASAPVPVTGSPVAAAANSKRRSSTSHGGTRLPKTYPFSSLVSQLCAALHRAVTQFFLFSAHLPVSSSRNNADDDSNSHSHGHHHHHHHHHRHGLRDGGDNEDGDEEDEGDTGGASRSLQTFTSLPDALMELLRTALRTICEQLSTELGRQGQETPISKACQMSIDGAALAQALDALHETISECFGRVHWTDPIDNSVTAVFSESQRTLQTLSIRSRDFVFELIAQKIDELLGGVEFVRWEASAAHTGPNSYCDDIINYLQVTFMCLTHLPLTVREAVHFASCTHVNAAVVEYVVESMPRVNMLGLYNLSVDVAALEAFADSCGVAQLRATFAELRSLVDAVTDPNVATLLADPNLRMSRFPSVGAAKIAAVLDAYTGPSSAQNVIATLPQLDKKTASSLAKRLRNK